MISHLPLGMCLRATKTIIKNKRNFIILFSQNNKLEGSWLRAEIETERDVTKLHLFFCFIILCDFPLQGSKISAAFKAGKQKNSKTQNHEPPFFCSRVSELQKSPANPCIIGHS